MHRRSLSALGALILLSNAALEAQYTRRDAGAGLPPRSGHFAFFDEARGRLTVFGGRLSPTTLGADCWQLDIGPDGEGPWAQSAAAPGTERAFGACCEDTSDLGIGLLFGGVDANGALLQTTLRWNRDTLDFDLLSPTTSPSPRSFNAMALDSARGRVVMFAGSDTRRVLRDTWEWNGLGWRQALPIQSPPARSNHALAYDSSNGLVVMQGGLDSHSFDDTWVFDGLTWSNVTPTRHPGALHNLMLAYDDNRHVVVLFGGKDDGGTVHDEVWEWNGTLWNGPVRPTTRPVARELGSLTYDTQRHRIVLAGGQDQAQTPLGDAWQWDGVGWTQLMPGNRGTLVQPTARFGAVFAYGEQNNRTVLFGGYQRQGLMSVPLNDTWESAGGLWQRRTPSTSPPASFAAAGAMLRGTGALCVLPGTDIFNNPYNEQWTFGSSAQWTSVPLQSAPLASVHQVLGSLLSSQFGWVLVRLVTTGSGLLRSSTLQLIVPNTGVVQTVSPGGGPPPSIGSTMAQTHSPSVAPDRVWLFGGSHESIGGPVYSSDAWELADLGGGALTWTLLAAAPTSPIPPPRIDAAVGYFNSGGGTTGLVITGGSDASHAALGDSWYFSFGNRTWYPTSGTPPSPRRHAVATSVGAQQVIFGGTDGTTEFDDEWSSGTSAWAQVVTPLRPTPRAHHAMVYDRTTRQYVLYGGDTWRYDGTTWSPFVGTGEIPWGRADAATCFDDARALLVLFGGGSPVGAFGDTHRLATTGDWTAGASGPPARTGAVMEYVASQRRCLMFGGLTRGVGIPVPPPVSFADTWLYDAGADQWQQVTGGPTGRALHAMAYDRLRDRVVLFGGGLPQNGPAGFSALGDTWEWNAATGWQQRTPAHQPPPRWAHMMAYDEARARIVMCGGIEETPSYQTWNSFDDIWEWDGNDWSQRQPETAGIGRHGSSMAYDPDRARLAYFGGSTQFIPLFRSSVGEVDVLTEFDAIVDLAGRGNTTNPEALRYYSQPELGEALQLGFANPQGLGLYMLTVGPVQQPIPLQAPPMCEPSNFYGLIVSYAVTGTSEPNVSLTLPTSPLIHGITLVFQGFALQPAGCWRATDALHVRL